RASALQAVDGIGRRRVVRGPHERHERQDDDEQHECDAHREGEVARTAAAAGRSLRGGRGEGAFGGGHAAFLTRGSRSEYSRSMMRLRSRTRKTSTMTIAWTVSRSRLATARTSSDPI